MPLTIDEVRNLGDPQRAYKWEVVLPLLNSRFGVLRTKNPSTSVLEVQGLPFSRIDSEAFYERGSNTYFPGLTDIDRITLVFYQNESSSIYEYVQSWKDLNIDPSGLKSLPDVYKRPIRVNLLNGRNEIVASYRLRGTFPTVTTPFNLDNSSDILTLIQEFSVDSINPVDPNAPDPDLTQRRALGIDATNSNTA